MNNSYTDEKKAAPARFSTYGHGFRGMVLVGISIGFYIDYL